MPAPEPVQENRILRRSRPLVLETPVERLDGFLTPVEAFFVRCHHDVPRVDAGSWRLQVTGLVERPLSLALADLRALPRVRLTAVLQCSGNGRAYFDPPARGVVWERGGVGNAEWTGVRLAEVLSLAGVDRRARWLVMQGQDRPQRPGDPRYARCLPLEKALHPDTLLAFEMNGQPLPPLHGHPLRAVVPGWGGNDWIKWLSLLHLQEEEFDGHFYREDYCRPRQPVAPGAEVAAEDMVPLRDMPVKSLLTHPRPGQRLGPGPVEIRGSAWTGDRAVVSRVQVSTDGGQTWSTAELSGPDLPYSWRPWRLLWIPGGPGRYRLISRATDSLGAEQPLDSTPWNPGGYGWNAADGVDVVVDVKNS
jgi:DMSO/TMAO reductase YedYZ molybdopterin-dependent catalytic subunit